LNKIKIFKKLSKIIFFKKDLKKLKIKKLKKLNLKIKTNKKLKKK